MSVDIQTRLFTVSEVSELFFDKPSHWLRYKDKIGVLVNLDGTYIGQRRNGQRVYTLEEIRQIAHSLRRVGTLSNEGLKNCLGRIDALCKPVTRGN